MRNSLSDVGNILHRKILKRTNRGQRDMLFDAGAH